MTISIRLLVISLSLNDSGQVDHTHVFLLSSSIMYYWAKNDNALELQNLTALALRHRPSYISTYRLKALKGNDHLPTLL